MFSRIVFFLKQVKHRLWLTLLHLEGLKDRFRLSRDFPGLKNQFNSSASILTNSYEYYTTTVSNPKMAVSLELAAFLSALCSTLNPRSILDLGSGYSTYIFSRYSQESNHSVKLWSVDDNTKWLAKTNTYLKKQKCHPTRLMHWLTFEKMHLPKLPFELILYDLGTMSTRKRIFPYVLNHTKKGTIIIVDDVHMLDYQRLVRELIRNKVTQCYSLRSLTLDTYRRFAMLVIR